MNTMIKNRLEWISEKLRVIPPTQYGFRRKRGCNDYLVNFMSDILTALTYNETTMVASLDITGAYDNVYIPELCNKMIRLNFPSKFIRYLHSWLTDRQVNVSSNYISLSRTTTRGLPQGSVLSPLLFAIYISQINVSLPNEIKSLQYADDIVIYFSHKKGELVSKNLQCALNKLSTAFDSLQLYFNESKCNTICFSRKRQDNIEQVTINGHLVPIRDNVRILGVILDHKLTFKQHIMDLVNRGSKDLNIIKSIICGTKGCNPNFAIQVYKSLIRSKLDYCCALFGHVSKSNLGKLDLIQNQALRLALGSFCSTPVIALQAEAAVMPLGIRRSILTDNLVYKILLENSHPAFRNMCYLNMLSQNNDYWQKKKLPLFIKSFNNVTEMMPNIMETEGFKNDWDFELPLFMEENSVKGDTRLTNLEVSKKNTSKATLKQLWLEKMSLSYLGYVYVYTDGSKTDDGCGAAFLIPRTNTTALYSLSKYMSSYSSELIAIYKAVQFINKTQYDNVVICTDSQAAVTAISNYSKDKSKNQLIISIVYELKALNKNIVFVWIPGHVSLDFNERVDNLARDAITTGVKIPEINVPLEDFKVARKRKGMEHYQVIFELTPKAHWYKNIVKKVSYVPWFKNSKLLRKEIVTISRLRLGHARVNSKLFAIKKYFTPLCLNCSLGVEETINHVVLQCPHYEYARKECFKLISGKFKHVNYDIKDVLKTNDLNIYKELGTFFVKIKKDI
uniref:Reverse transcriptase domain-containing protein n=1 Tax=Homalodisca liturata TaxID=320908 RepID=A0A1B6J7I1_9HEMI